MAWTGATWKQARFQGYPALSLTGALVNMAIQHIVFLYAADGMHNVQISHRLFLQTLAGTDES